MFNLIPSVLRQNDTSADGTLPVAEAIARGNAPEEPPETCYLRWNVASLWCWVSVQISKRREKKRPDCGMLNRADMSNSRLSKKQRRQLLFQACWEPLRPDLIAGSLRRYVSRCLCCTRRHVPQQAVVRRTARDDLDAETRGRVIGCCRLSQSVNHQPGNRSWQQRQHLCSHRSPSWGQWDEDRGVEEVPESSGSVSRQPGAALAPTSQLNAVSRRERPFHAIGWTGRTQLPGQKARTER